MNIINLCNMNQTSGLRIQISWIHVLNKRIPLVPFLSCTWVFHALESIYIERDFTDTQILLKLNPYIIYAIDKLTKSNRHGKSVSENILYIAMHSGLYFYSLPVQLARSSDVKDIGIHVSAAQQEHYIQL